MPSCIQNQAMAFWRSPRAGAFPDNVAILSGLLSACFLVSDYGL